MTTTNRQSEAGSWMSFFGLLFVMLIVSATLVLTTFLQFRWGLQESPDTSAFQERRLLPATATDVKDEFNDHFVDYSYYLRAKLNREEFDTYSDALNLVDSKPPLNVGWNSDGLQGWRPTASSNGVRWKWLNGEFIFAKYEDGYLYLQAFSSDQKPSDQDQL